MALSGAERQAALAAKRKAAGLVQVAVWVPENRKADVHAVAEWLAAGNAWFELQRTLDALRTETERLKIELEQAARALEASQQVKQGGEEARPVSGHGGDVSPIRAARLAAGYASVSALAKALGMPRTTLSEIENGKILHGEGRTRVLAFLGLSGSVG